ncbi:host-nuclease inhibitor Gam family protein [Patescibacteria group bacterium]|nr:host-nuclease inhibitor Gam family protein [Patescibacteria group bacterium]
MFISKEPIVAKKHTFPIPTNDAEAAQLLGELEKLKLKLEQQQVELNQAINVLVVVADQKAAKVSDEFAEKFTILKEYARTHKTTLTDNGKQRSVTWATGTLGWRNTPAGISVPRSAKEVVTLIERLITLRKLKFLRRKWELNVEAMEASPDEATAIEGISKRAASETIYIQFAKGDEIKQKIKLKTPSVQDITESE